MIIKSIDLQNFRNYKLQHIDFDSNINIIYGDNAQGKTNILEAIYLAGTTKSHKGCKDAEMINFAEDEAHIKAIVSKNGIDYRIDMHLKKGRTKGIAINGVPIRKSYDLIGIVNQVFFSPEDLSIINNGPAERRRFMDMELSQLSRLYLENILKYNKVLDQRNKLLKDMSFDSALSDTLEIWDMQLISYGKKIIIERQKFTEDINKIIGNVHNKLSGGKENLIIEYEPSVKADAFESQLIKNRDRDIKTKMTNIGPHRDDISFVVNDIDIRKYGSQGQKRTTALSLKMAEILLVKEKTGDTPILLLDDVLSELDSNRQNYLLNSIENVQTLITCTGLDDFVDKRIYINKTIHIIDGQVTDRK